MRHAFEPFCLLFLGPLACLTIGGCGGDESQANAGGSTTTTQTGGEGGSGGSGAGGAGGTGGSGGNPTMESVIVVDPIGAPIEDVDIVVNTAAGEVTDHVKTDASGQALVDVPEDGSVTVAHGFSSIQNSQVYLQRNLTTAVGLEDGGTFRVESGRATPWEPPTGMTVTVGLHSQCITPPGVTHYRVQLSCRHGGQTNLGQPHQFPDYWGCDGEPTYDVFLFAFDAEDKLLRYSAQLDHPFQAGGSASHQLCPTNSNLTETTFAVSDVPPQTDSVSLNLYGSRNATTNAALRRTLHDDAPTATVTGFLRLPTAELSVFADTIGVRFTPDGGPFYSDLVQRRKNLISQPATVSLSVSDFAVVDALPVADLSQVERPRVSWNLSTTGALGDMLSVGLSWTPADHEFSFWHVVHPAERNGEVQLPDLPSALSEFPPGVGDTIGQTTLVHMDQDGVDGLRPYLEGAPNSDTRVWASAGHYPQ